MPQYKINLSPKPPYQAVALPNAITIASARSSTSSSKALAKWKSMANPKPSPQAMPF